MPDIRTVAVPPGIAPLEVRRTWVGLRLPVASVGKQGRVRAPSTGGVQGRQTFGGWIGVWVRNGLRFDTYYAVEGTSAIDILSETQPEAAAWYRENQPNLLRSGTLMGFPVEVCQEEATLVAPSPTSRGDGAEVTPTE